MKSLTYILLSILFLFSCSSSKSAVETPKPAVVSPTLDGGKWKLLTMRGKEPKYSDIENQITLSFNSEAKTINGYAGCNRYFGNFTTHDLEKIKFTEIGSTKRACGAPSMDLENSFLQSLGRINAYAFANNELQLLQNERVIFVFEKE